MKVSYNGERAPKVIADIVPPSAGGVDVRQPVVRQKAIGALQADYLLMRAQQSEEAEEVTKPALSRAPQFTRIPPVQLLDARLFAAPDGLAPVSFFSPILRIFDSVLGWVRTLPSQLRPGLFAASMGSSKPTRYTVANGVHVRLASRRILGSVGALALVLVGVGLLAIYEPARHHKIVTQAHNNSRQATGVTSKSVSARTKNTPPSPSATPGAKPQTSGAAPASTAPTSGSGSTPFGNTTGSATAPSAGATQPAVGGLGGGSTSGSSGTPTVTGGSNPYPLPTTVQVPPVSSSVDGKPLVNSTGTTLILN